MAVRKPPYISVSTSDDQLEQTGFSPFSSTRPQSPYLGRIRRRMFRGRKQILIGLTIILIALFFLASTSNPTTRYAKAKLSCNSARANPYGIVAPTVAKADLHAKGWKKLKELFDNYGTFPPFVAHPEPPPGDEPLSEKVKHLFPITADEAERTRKNHAKIIEYLPDYPQGLYKGKGVVMLAGGHYSEFAATALGMLRETGSQLPVEVWVQDEREEKHGWCDELEAEGMACRKLSDYLTLSDLKHPYQMKILTMLFSSFEEIIFLDADAIPMQNVDGLLESKIYQEFGVILWPDYWKNTPSPWMPYIMGLGDRAESKQIAEKILEEQSVESGQMVWHKRKHWKSLLLATYYNYLGPSYYYSLQNCGFSGWGDKGTFPMALKALAEPYYQVAHGIGTVFRVGSVHGIGMVQYDPRNILDAKPMILHSNIIKFSMRDFLCEGCAPIWTAASDPAAKFHSMFEDEHSEIAPSLRNFTRIFRSDGLQAAGFDPEPLIWKAMEYTACRSKAWGSAQTCERAREHMQKTFGFQFRPSTLSGKLGHAEEVCILDPAVPRGPDAF